jgi:exonuclease III
MALKHQRCKNIHNLKPTNNSTFQQNLINSRYTHASNVISNGTCNNNSNNSAQDCSNNSRSVNSHNNTPLLIYHQNIRGLQNKTDELSILWSINFPHILCFTEHHLRSEGINCTYINSYNLGAKYCRVNCKYGGVSIFVHETLPFSPIDLNEFCNDQDIEICAVKSHLSTFNFYVLSVYRSTSGNFVHFLSSLDSVLNQLYYNSLNIIICGDFNINYLENSNNKLRLPSRLLQLTKCNRLPNKNH